MEPRDKSTQNQAPPEQISAYVVIPAYIFFDRNLSDEERWLYGYISSHSNLKGYCFATNKRIAEDWGCSVRKVAGVLASLVGKGYVYACVDRKNGKAKRRVFLTDIMALRQFCRDHSAKNCTMDDARNCTNHDAENCTSNNINNNNIPPIAPQGGQQPKRSRKRKSPTGAVELPPALEDSFQRFWSVYPRKKDRQNARLRWLQLEPDEELVNTILTAIQTLEQQDEDWKRNVIPLPSTFLNNRRWEDAASLTAEPKREERWF